MNLTFLQELEQARQENKELKKGRLAQLQYLEKKAKDTLKEMNKLRQSIQWWQSRDMLDYADEITMILKEKVDKAYKDGIMSKRGYNTAYNEFSHKWSTPPQTSHQEANTTLQPHLKRTV